MKSLGKSDIKVTALGLGAWAIGGEWTMTDLAAGWGKVDDAESIRAICAGLEAGANLIDTAANYGTGHSEHIVGQAVKGKRDRVVIATKFGFDVNEDKKAVTYYKSPDDILRSLPAECERSLRYLDCDWIDLYQFHMWEFPPERIPDLLEILERLVEQGKIRTYGWSTDDANLARIFAQGKHCAAIQHRSNVLEPTPEMFAFTQETGLISLIRSPLLMGLLSDKYDENTQFVATDVRSRMDRERTVKFVENRLRIREVLTSGGRSVAQGAIAWLWALGQQVIPIPGIRTVAQAQENVGAMQFGALTAQQMAEIDHLLGRDEVKQE